MTWDFGGQEEYYATHQCFLTQRSLYVLVWNVNDGVEGLKDLKHWLENIGVSFFSACTMNDLLSASSTCSLNSRIFVLKLHVAPSLPAPSYLTLFPLLSLSPCPPSLLPLLFPLPYLSSPLLSPFPSLSSPLLSPFPSLSFPPLPLLSLSSPIYPLPSLLCSPISPLPSLLCSPLVSFLCRDVFLVLL